MDAFKRWLPSAGKMFVAIHVAGMLALGTFLFLRMQEANTVASRTQDL